MVDFVDYYKILQVDPAADLAVIEAAFRKLSSLYHPDINKEPDAENKYKTITEAYFVLKDKNKRQKYDIIYNSFTKEKPVKKTNWLVIFIPVSILVIILIIFILYFFILRDINDLQKNKIVASITIATKLSSDSFNLKTIKSGVLTVGSDCTWPPMEYIAGGKIVGFDVDLTQAIADKLDLKLDYQNATWDSIFGDVAAHKYDMIISSITITNDRKKVIGFSYPYYRVDQSVIVNKYSGIDSIDKFKGKIAAVQIGTTGELVVKDTKDVRVKTYDDILLAFEELKVRKIDGVVCDSYMGYAYVARDDDLTVGFDIIGNEQLGIGFAKDTPELVEAVNKALKEIMEDGTYDEIYEKWFGLKFN